MLRSLLSMLVCLGGLAACTEPQHEVQHETDQTQDLSATLTPLLFSEQRVKQNLSRIDALNSRLHAVIAVNPNALEDAISIDRRAVTTDSPLFGHTVLIKDNIESKEAIPTTAGSLVLKDNITSRDAPLVANMREAGLVILGKANLSEWANFRSESSISGWSAMGGQTRNPYDLSRNSCGSSSGSAVAVAAGLTDVAIGTETDGSIICPSAINGIVGIKPTLGLVSRRYIVPLAHSQDTAGPMAKTVADAAALLTVISSYDDQDTASEALAIRGGRDVFDRNYSTYLDAEALKGSRLGVLRSEAGFDDQVDQRFEQAIDRLKASGAVIIDDLSLPETDEAFWNDYYDVLLYEFKADLNQYLKQLPGPEKHLDLAAIIAFNQQHQDQELAVFDQSIFEKSQQSKDLTDPHYLQALDKTRRLARDSLDKLITDHRLDGLIQPSNAPAWLIDPEGDKVSGGSTSFPAISGYPHITIPMGYVDGLPVGLSFIGTALTEPRLIALAYAYEQASQMRREPSLDIQ